MAQRFDYGDEDMPIVSYDLVFPDRRRLLPVSGGTSSAHGFPDQTEQDTPERLSDHIEWDPRLDLADRVDYAVAAASGVVAGLVDSLFVGELSLDRAGEWGSKTVERLVVGIACAEGYKGDSLKEAIRNLEKVHPLAADGNTPDFGGGRQHHLRDFAHHFGIGGLAASIFTQFTGLSIGTDTAGRLVVVRIPEDHRRYLGRDVPEKLVFGTVEWFFHMVSDMAGSSGNAGAGTGIPGPLLSFMKELSVLPFFRDSGTDGMGFRLWLSKMFNGTFLAEHDADGRIIKGTERRFDLRMEIGVLGEIGRQSMPVVINQCVTRAFYFCRRLSREIDALGIGGVGDLGRIAPEDVLPWGTPAMRRMLIVSSGVFVGVDIADAAVHAMAGEDKARVFLLRVNYVGIATFVVSCVVDAKAVMAERWKDNAERERDAIEHELADLDCLELDPQKARVLHSLMRQKVLYDIEREKHDRHAERKGKWLDEWSRRITQTIGVEGDGYFLDGKSLYDEINGTVGAGNGEWLWLVALELVMFKPYFPLHGDNDKEYKSLKARSDYIGDVFCQKQTLIAAKELHGLGRGVKNMENRLDGAMARRLGGTACVVVAVAATGGLAFYLAPAVAPVFAAAFGFEAAGLYGAALTSASLAFLGGGSLIAGGAGMAGGTMLIVGGGAVLGAAGGAGMSAAASMAMATNGDYVLEECAKLTAFCKDVLVKRYGDLASAYGINVALNRRIIELEARTEAVRRGIRDGGADGDGDGKASPKKMLKILNRSLKYMKRANKELVKVLKDAGRKSRQPLLDPSPNESKQGSVDIESEGESACGTASDL